MIEGFINLWNPLTLLVMVLGVAWGIILGGLPGFGATLGMAILIPFTYGMPPTVALPALAAIYTGAIYGGGITAILFGIPGTSAAAATVQDGYAMTKKGESLKALTTSVYASTIGGITGGICLLLFAPLLAKGSLAFGPAEYFMLAVFGLTVIATVSGTTLWKGLAAGGFGVFLGMVGLDPINGSSRLTFGQMYVVDGLPIIPVILALFAFPRSLEMLGDFFSNQGKPPSQPELSGEPIHLKELRGLWRTLIRSSLLGTFIGMIPGAGSNIACWIGVAEAKRKSKTPEKFGTGIPEGVAAAEAANNATEGGSLVPLLTLSIPGSSAAAVMFGAFMIHGLVPGPALFSKHSSVTYTYIFSIIFTNFIMLGMGYYGSRLFARITQIPTQWLAPFMLVVTAAGAYMYRQLVFDISLTILLGLLCFGLGKFKFSMPAILLGFILGPIAEKGIRRALIISNGDLGEIFFRPLFFATA